MLAKNAYLFLGEICLGDSALAAAASLRGLAKLNLSSIRVQDEGFASLAMLPHLTHLTLRGQLNVTLVVLSQVFVCITKLEELNLGVLVPSNYDLKRIAAVHAGLKRPATRRRQQQQQSRRSIRQQLQQQQQQLAQLQLQEQHGAAGDHSSSRGPAAGRRQSSSGSSRVSGHASNRAASSLHGVDVPSSAAVASDGDSSTPSRSSSSLSRSSSSTASSSSSGGGLKFKGEDWSAVLLPLQRLRRLSLHSDLVLLGGCAALRGMASVSHLELHGGAKFLSAGPFASLPPSWLSTLARPSLPPASTAASGAAAAAAGSSLNRTGGGGLTSATDLAAAVGMAGRCPSSTNLVAANGVWPALKSLQVDNLQLADDVVEAVRQLASLRTLILSGPCLLAQQQQQQQRQASLQQQQQVQVQTAAAAAAGPSLTLPPLQQQQQPIAVSEDSSAAKAGPQLLAPTRQLNSSIVEIEPASSSSEEELEHRRQPQRQQQQPPGQAVVPELRSLSGLSGVSAQPQDFWPEPPAAAAVLASPSTSTAAVPAAVGPGGGASAAFGGGLRFGGAPAPLPADLDCLSRLSPLDQLSCFHLHLQQNMPCGE